MTATHTAAADALRIGIIDADTGFVQDLTKRLERLGWEHLAFTGEEPVERLVAMRLGAVQAYAYGRSIDLTRRESELMQLLASEARVVEHEERVWGHAVAHGDRSGCRFAAELAVRDASAIAPAAATPPPPPQPDPTARSHDASARRRRSPRCGSHAARAR